MIFNLFYSNLIISPELVETLIVPIPKVESVQSLADIHPINLVVFSGGFRPPLIMKACCGSEI
jgi:hypothetical protein